MRETIMIWDRRPEYMFRKRGISEVYQEYVYKLMPYNNIQDIYKQLKYPLTVYEESKNSIMEFNTDSKMGYGVKVNIPKGHKPVRFRIDTNYILDTLSRADNAKLFEFEGKNRIELQSGYASLKDKNIFDTFDDYVIYQYIKLFNKDNKNKHYSGYRELVAKGSLLYINSKIHCGTYIKYTLVDNMCIKGIEI